MKLPDDNATLDELVDFALSFNGYSYIGNETDNFWDKVNNLWDNVITLLNEDEFDNVSLEDIRACMFFQQRSDRWAQDYSIQHYQYFLEKLKKKLDK